MTDPAIRSTDSNSSSSEKKNHKIPEVNSDEPMIELIDSDSASEEEFCPLFSVGLPKNFQQNRHLAALACLMEPTTEVDEAIPLSESEVKREMKTRESKAIKRRSRDARRSEPYTIRKGSRQITKSATIGEAQLFLSMWTI
jgi:hypothetical protein